MNRKKTLPDNHTNPGEEEIFENFKIDLSELKPAVREKALDLSKGFISKGIPHEKAIAQAIQEAETWFLESQG